MIEGTHCMLSISLCYHRESSKINNFFMNKKNKNIINVLLKCKKFSSCKPNEAA